LSEFLLLTPAVLVLATLPPPPSCAARLVVPFPLGCYNCISICRDK
jgi:hypothetical protein